MDGFQSGEIFILNRRMGLGLKSRSKIVPGTGVPENWHSNLADSPSKTLLFTISITKEGADLYAEND